MKQPAHSFRLVLAALPLALVIQACLGDVEVAPPAPTLFPVTSPTRLPTQTIEGTKPAGAAVLDAGEVIVAHDEHEDWSFELALEPGENLLSLTSQWPSGKQSEQTVEATIVFEPNFPGQPTVTQISSPTNQTSQTLFGTKPMAAGLVLDWLDGQGAVTTSEQVLPLGDETTWDHLLSISGQDGVYSFSLRAVDAGDKPGEPFDFQVELDREPPRILTRYPLPGDTGVPTNTLISVGLDGPLDVSVDQVDQDLLVATDSLGERVNGSLSYSPTSNSFTLSVPLGADAQYTLSLDSSRFTDAAGNRAEPQPAEWTWSFTTGAMPDDVNPPAPVLDTPPEVDPGTGHTQAAVITLGGSKAVYTSIWVNGKQVVPLDDRDAWSTSWLLFPGENTISVAANSRAGLTSPSTLATYHRDALKPGPPVVDPPPPESVSEPGLFLTGSREADTSVLLNGVVIVPRSPETAWTYNADLVPGPNELVFQSRAVDGTLSDPVAFLVDFSQTYQGPVEAGFKLLISFSLRDLSGVAPIRSTFDTGSNRYSVDAWIEGPLESGEVCQFDEAEHERRSIKYVATLVHYIGQKEGHTNPFWDADYRAPDYLAALISGGVFEGLGLGADADRRGPDGRQGGDLVDGTGKIRLTTQDLRTIDGVTEATQPAGMKLIEWLPLGADLQRIDQGEYLVHLLISLDRDPSWVAVNDLETCWSQEDHAARGQHRIVKRLGLGAQPFTTTVGQAAELAGPDLEDGADQLRYITPEGVTFRWVHQP